MSNEEKKDTSKSVNTDERINIFDEYSLINLLKHVASRYSIEKMFGDKGQREDVAIGIGTTIAKLAFMSSNKDSIVDNYLVEDYKLPSGSGLLELASVADIWLFSGTFGIRGCEVLKKDILKSFFNSWVKFDKSQEPLWDSGECYTPQRLVTELNSIYRLNGQNVPAYMNVKKEELTLDDISILDGMTISDKSDMRSKALSSFMGFTNKGISQYGVPSVGESDRALASWLFSTSGQQSEVAKEG